MDSLQSTLQQLTRISETLSEQDKEFLMSLYRKLEQQASDVQLLEEVNEKKDGHLIKNGKEIIALTHEKCLLLEVINDAPNKEELLLKFEEFKNLPLS